MKLALFLSLLVLTLAESQSSSRNLHENATDLSNGAVLDVDVFNVNATLPHTIGSPISVRGNASVGEGTPDVSYIYIIDTSGSTAENDGACGTVLECVQKFFEAFELQAIEDGSAELISAINFDDVATVVAELQPPGNTAVINDAIQSGQSDGDTNCASALLKAAEIVLSKKNTAGTTVVVFAGDGQCTDDSSDVIDAATVLGETGAIVHTVAVGDTVDCQLSQGYSNSFLNITQNGGDCASVPDPNTLPHIIDQLIGTSIVALEINVDGTAYTDIERSNVTVVDDNYNTNRTGYLPQEGAVTINFDTTVDGLEIGDHEICVRVTGTDVLGDVKSIADCHQIRVVPKEKLAAWAIVLIVFALLGLVLVLAYAIQRFCFTRKEAPAPDDLELAESSRGNEGII